MERIDQPQYPPPNYLLWAILTTIFCCLPFGIVSIIFAAQVNTKWDAGDYDGAMNASRNAKIWAWVSFFVTLLIVFVYSALAILGIVVPFGIASGVASDAFNF
jgi:hypothetical protein